MLPVEDPGFCTVEKSGENRSSLDFDLGRQVQGVVLPHVLLKTSKRAVSFGDAVVDIVIQLLRLSFLLKIIFQTIIKIPKQSHDIAGVYENGGIFILLRVKKTVNQRLLSG